MLVELANFLIYPFSSEISGYRDPVSLDQDDFNVTVRIRLIILFNNYSLDFVKLTNCPLYTQKNPE